jgi:hypothetical protein
LLDDLVHEEMAVMSVYLTILSVEHAVLVGRVLVRRRNERLLLDDVVEEGFVHLGNSVALVVEVVSKLGIDLVALDPNVATFLVELRHLVDTQIAKHLVMQLVVNVFQIQGSHISGLCDQALYRLDVSAATVDQGALLGVFTLLGDLFDGNGVQSHIVSVLSGLSVLRYGQII